MYIKHVMSLIKCSQKIRNLYFIQKYHVHVHCTVKILIQQYMSKYGQVLMMVGWLVGCLSLTAL